MAGGRRDSWMVRLIASSARIEAHSERKTSRSAFSAGARPTSARQLTRFALGVEKLPV